MLVSLGVVQGAVEVYQRLELWEEVATCYQAAGRRERAEEVVRERLKEHETPTLWCILGDVTQVCGEGGRDGKRGERERDEGRVGEWVKSFWPLSAGSRVLLESLGALQPPQQQSTEVSRTVLPQERKGTTINCYQVCSNQ